jgi:hypothetical protein
MHILSFDCASKNMGVTLLEIDFTTLTSIREIYSAFMKNYTVDSVKDINKVTSMLVLAKKLNYMLSQVIKINEVVLLDVVGEEVEEEHCTYSTGIIARTACLKRTLENFDLTHEIPNDTIVLIEYQMKQNDISRSISNQILYHYSNYTVHLCGPTLKNTFSFHDSLDYRHFISKYSNYVANKKQTTANFKYFCENMGLVELNEFKKLDDVADAFMQAISWFKQYCSGVCVNTPINQEVKTKIGSKVKPTKKVTKLPTIVERST